MFPSVYGLFLLYSQCFYIKINTQSDYCLFTDRYKSLPHSSQKLSFLDLQLELLEDFRVRIIQVKDNTHNPYSDCFCSILNTAHYVTEVLREWSELVVSNCLLVLLETDRQLVYVLIFIIFDELEIQM